MNKGQLKNEEGKRFGKLTVLSYTPGSNHIVGKWSCKCDCGKIILVLGKYLRNGRIISCGCSRTSAPHSLKNIIGLVFGKLTVVSYNGEQKWQCNCECGNTCIIHRNALIQNRTKSCGCFKSECMAKRKNAISKTER